MKIILVAGARPNFMKVAPLVRAIERYNASVPSEGQKIVYLLVHTGQHYDLTMSDLFFKDLRLPQAHIHLGVGSGTHAEQTGKVMMEFEKVLFRENTDLVIVVGDVNSTLACTLAAVKLHIPVAHVEAGLRSFDRSMPEEVNRLVTDALSTYLFTPSSYADENLLREGIPPERIYQVGDIMVDSLLFHLDEAKKSDILDRLGLRKESSTPLNSVAPYTLLTLHRPSNVDDQTSLQHILAALEIISQEIPIIFPIHPRTQKQLAYFDLQNKVRVHDIVQGADLSGPGIHSIDPLGYLDFMSLMVSAQFVITDSGGIQEETTVLGIPCLTLRKNTERPITVSKGTNTLVGADKNLIISEAHKILNGFGKKGTIPELWDGKTAERIVRVIGDG
jgi:UDP-N-acetylglucosamine 2-epimerase (non-hydrolysing)